MSDLWLNTGRALPLLVFSSVFSLPGPHIFKCNSVGVLPCGRTRHLLVDEGLWSMMGHPEYFTGIMGSWLNFRSCTWVMCCACFPVKAH